MDRIAINVNQDYHFLSPSQFFASHNDLKTSKIKSMTVWLLICYLPVNLLLRNVFLNFAKFKHLQTGVRNMKWKTWDDIKLNIQNKSRKISNYEHTNARFGEYDTYFAAWRLRIEPTQHSLRNNNNDNINNLFSTDKFVNWHERTPCRDNL